MSDGIMSDGIMSDGIMLVFQAERSSKKAEYFINFDLHPMRDDCVYIRSLASYNNLALALNHVCFQKYSDRILIYRKYKKYTHTHTHTL